MEYITDNNLQTITDCVAFARQFLLLPDAIEYYFENCPSQRFPSMNNVAESDIRSIYFNKQWFLQRIGEHRDDLQFFIFHELRHIHQLYSIFLHDQSPNNDNVTTIELWRNGFNNYIRNTDAITEVANVVQEIEIDANAYAQCLVNLMHIDDDMDIRLSLPKTVANIVCERSMQYYDSEPKLKRFVDNWKATHLPVQNTKRKMYLFEKCKRWEQMTLVHAGAEINSSVVAAVKEYMTKKLHGVAELTIHVKAQNERVFLPLTWMIILCSWQSKTEQRVRYETSIDRKCL